MHRENTIALSHQYVKQFKNIQQLDKIDSSESKTSEYSKGAVVNFNRFGYKFSFVRELWPSLVSRRNFTHAKVFIFIKLFFYYNAWDKVERWNCTYFCISIQPFSKSSFIPWYTNQSLCDCISLSQFQVRNHQKPQSPLAWKAVLFLTHRSPLPPYILITLPHRMLDYISEDPKTRLDMLAGYLKWKTLTNGCKWIFSKPQG